MPKTLIRKTAQGPVTIQFGDEVFRIAANRRKISNVPEEAARLAAALGFEVKDARRRGARNRGGL